MFPIQNGMKEIESYFQSVSAEAAHFFEAGGDMTMTFVVSMNNKPDGFFCRAIILDGSKSRVNFVMLLEELKRAVESVG